MHGDGDGDGDGRAHLAGELQGAIARIVQHGIDRGVDSDDIAREILTLLEDPRLTRAIGHPVRAAVLRHLRDDGPVSPSRLAERIGLTTGTVAYHFRILDELGLIEIDREVPRRGAVEHFYRLRVPSHVDGDGHEAVG